VGSQVVIASCEGTIAGLNKWSGTVLWSYKAVTSEARRVYFHADPVVADDLFIVPSDSGVQGGAAYIYAIEWRSGTLGWKHRVVNGVMADLVRDGSNVYAVTLADELLCLDIGTGRARWTFTRDSGGVKDRSRTTPAVASGNVFFGSQRGVLYALVEKSGTILWQRDLGSPIRTPILSFGKRLFVGTGDMRVVSVDAHTGAIADYLRIEAHSLIDLVAIDLGASKRLLVSMWRKQPGGGVAQVLTAVDPDTLRVVWTCENAPYGWTSVRPRAWREYVVIGDAEGNVAAVRVRDGQVRALTNVAGIVRGIGSEGEMLFVGTRQGRLYAHRVDLLSP
jgi:outer membrane protein assembly factor BamB